MSGLIESSSSLCPLLLPDIGSESKGQVLCVKTRGLNNFLRMVDGEENEQMQMLGIWESKQRNQSAVKKKKKRVCAVGEFWCHSTTTHKGWLFSLWIPDIVHSAGGAVVGRAPNEYQCCQEQLLHTMSWHFLRKKRCQTDPPDISTQGTGASQTPGCVATFSSMGENLAPVIKRLPNSRSGAFKSPSCSGERPEALPHSRQRQGTSFKLECVK